MIREACGPAGASAARRAVAAGGTVAFPTDTVYGLGCDPRSRRAVAAVAAIKGRDPSKPLPVLGATAEQLGGLCELGPAHRALASRFWPGPLTLLARATDREAISALGLPGTAAVRIPASPCARSLLLACGALACTSANLSGAPPAADASACAALGPDVLVDGGPAPGGAPSTIFDPLSGRVLREGALPAGEVLSAWRS